MGRNREIIQILGKGKEAMDKIPDSEIVEIIYRLDQRVAEYMNLPDYLVNVLSPLEQARNDSDYCISYWNLLKALSNSNISSKEDERVLEIDKEN